MAKLQVKKDAKIPRLEARMKEDGVDYTTNDGKVVAKSKKKSLDESFDEAVKFATAPKTLMKKGGAVKKYARGGGIEKRGKTKGRMC